MGWKFFNSSGQLQTEAPIADDSVTNAKLANTAAYTIKGNATSSSANPTDISLASATGGYSIHDNDIVLTYDADGSALKTITRGNFLSGVGGARTVSPTNVDNAVITFVDSGDTFAAEANLTFDGTNLTVATGNVIIGTAGKGIDFSAQTATSASGATTTPSEVLDHYEEGTWTPVFKEANSPFDAASMRVQHGKYVRIGRIVYITGWAKTNGLSNMSTSDGVTLTGLPFTVSSSGTGASWYGGGLNVVQGEGLGITANQHVTGYIEPGTTLVTLKRWGDTAGTTAFTGSNLSADGGIMFNGFYLTEA